MAIALRGVSWYSLASTSSATSHVFTIPAGTVAGDCLVLAFVTNGVATQVSTAKVRNYLLMPDQMMRYAEVWKK